MIFFDWNCFWQAIDLIIFATPFWIWLNQNLIRRYPGCCFVSSKNRTGMQHDVTLIFVHENICFSHAWIIEMMKTTWNQNFEEPWYWNKHNSCLKKWHRLIAVVNLYQLTWMIKMSVSDNNMQWFNRCCRIEVIAESWEHEVLGQIKNSNSFTSNLFENQ